VILASLLDPRRGMRRGEVPGRNGVGRRWQRQARRKHGSKGWIHDQNLPAGPDPEADVAEKRISTQDELAGGTGKVRIAATQVTLFAAIFAICAW